LSACYITTEREEKRQLGTRRRKWEDNIKIDIKGIGGGGGAWTGLLWLRLVTSGTLL
jgi:hypothetical protein